MSRGSLSPEHKRLIVMMLAVVAGLHLVGFYLLIAVVAPAHYYLGASGTFTIGLGLTAYTLGMRHAFDADHIAAIDNTTRKLMSDGQRPLSVGFWFSLGHSTVVLLLAFLLGVGVRALDGALRNPHSNLHEVAGSIGTLVSGGFLWAIAAVNLAVLVAIIKMFGRMRTGRLDQQELDRQLDSRGIMNRFFGRLTKTISHPRHMYPIGALFGLGFDTATEVALLVVASGAGAAGLPLYAIACLPILFAAGMSLLDTLEGSLMNVVYGWAVADPVRRVFYNMTITGLSVMVAAVIGTTELGGLIASHLKLSGRFWSWLEHIDINSLGIPIAVMFVATWVIALSIWHFGHIEERWKARSQAALTRD